MFPPVYFKSDDPQGKVSTRHLEGNIVETSYKGACTYSLVQSTLEIIPQIIKEIPNFCCLLDMSGVTEMDMKAGEPGQKILQLFKENGGIQLAIVVSNMWQRVFLKSAALAAGLPVQVFETRDKALEYLKTLPPK